MDYNVLEIAIMIYLHRMPECQTICINKQLCSLLSGYFWSEDLIPFVYSVKLDSDYILHIVNLQIIIVTSSCLGLEYFYSDINACLQSLV